MPSPEAPVRPKTFKEGASHARAKRRNVSEGGLSPLNGELLAVPPDIFNYIFKLQVQVEKTGVMDYHEYAKRMWKQLAGEEQSEKVAGFKQFEGNMILGLHNIDMTELVYPDLLETIPILLEKYKDDVRSVAVWSTGDVSATGYQPGKIDRSRIIGKFLGTLGQKLGKGRGEFVRSKTAYLVDDDKYDRLAEYAQQKHSEKPSEKVKIVILEDSSGSFEKAQGIVDERLGPDRAEIVPIWFTASREGTNAQKAVDQLKDTQDYDLEKQKLAQKKNDLNAIRSFDELLDEGRFGEIFKDGHVMVDFDGVICDNIRMRDRQAEVIYNALVDGVSSATGNDPEIASQIIMDNLVLAA